MAERPWGFWTESKLDMLSAYLPAFTTASKSAPSTVYLDLFAGQATNVSRDTGRPVEGSLLRALQTTPPFTVVPPSRTKVELFLLLASPQIVRVVNGSLNPHGLEHAKQQVTDLFGSTEWRPILDGRQSGALDTERTRDELTNLMRWRLEKTLGYGFTHTLRLTNVNGVPLYDMIFATDHAVGEKIMKSVCQKAAERFPAMRQEARARRRDRKEQESGSSALFTHEELIHDAPLRAHESYQHNPPVPPTARLLAPNMAGIRAYEQAGFKFIGRRRNSGYLAGCNRSSRVYGHHPGRLLRSVLRHTDDRASLVTPW